MGRIFKLILIIILTIGSIWALVHYIRMDKFAFAWILNFLLMFFVAVFTETLNSQLSSSYFDEKSWEQRGQLYQTLGTNFYRKLLVLTGWEKLTRKANPIERSNETLKKLHYQTKKSELDHVIILLIVAVFNVFAAFKVGVAKSLWWLLLNILFNLYPIFLQRYNRPRIQRAINLSRRQ
jgi:hypothetical protein